MFKCLNSSKVPKGINSKMETATWTIKLFEPLNALNSLNPSSFLANFLLIKQPLEKEFVFLYS